MAKNQRLADFMDRELAGESLTITDVAAMTGLTRAIVGAYIRGERDTFTPSEVNVICKRVGIRVEKFLAAAGFDVAVTPALDVDPKLAEWWPKMAPVSQLALLELAQAAAKAAEAAASSAP